MLTGVGAWGGWGGVGGGGVLGVRERFGAGDWGGVVVGLLLGVVGWMGSGRRRSRQSCGMSRQDPVWQGQITHCFGRHLWVGCLHRNLNSQTVSLPGAL